MVVGEVSASRPSIDPVQNHLKRYYDIRQRSIAALYVSEDVTSSPHICKAVFIHQLLVKYDPLHWGLAIYIITRLPKEREARELMSIGINESTNIAPLRRTDLTGVRDIMPQPLTGLWASGTRNDPRGLGGTNILEKLKSIELALYDSTL